MKKLRIFSGFAVLWSLCFAAPAFAHGLNVFAWLENDRILARCDFGRGRPAADATITVRDSVDDRELFSGKTGKDGGISFPVPEVVRQGHGLRIIADAGAGHRGEWTMDASELYSAASLAAGFDEAAIQAQKNAVAAQTARAASAPASPPQAAPQKNDIHPIGAPDDNAITKTQIRDIVHEALELKLAPIRQEIAARTSSGPTFAEIIGGIGWIIGLVGIGLYFKARRG